MPSAVIIDTNILIDHFNGLHEAHQELNYHRDAMISIITWIEMMSAYEAKLAAGLLSYMEFEAANLALGTFPVIAIDKRTMVEAAKVRGRSLYLKRKLALPDAIIEATAKTSQRVLITRNTKDFDMYAPHVRVPYIAETTAGAQSIPMNLFTPSSSLHTTVIYVALPPN